ncbi:MAG: CoA transferase [Desulfuromonadales bacterium]|nr:CoA transferase [Desulfuromonadales bacterium]
MLDNTLHGFRVLDLSQYLPGPYATRLLADLGADVVKVEPPGGDPMRSFIFLDDDGLSPLYKQVNAGKTVLRLDLKSEADCSRFAALVTAADVLLESYRPGVMERLGFGPDQLRALNPALVHCAISGFGQSGPASQRAGHDLTYMALSGMLHHTQTTKTPVIPFPPVSDYASGQHAASMILAALLRREKRGGGCFIDTSLFETILSWQSFGQAGIGRSGRALDPNLGLITGGMACYQIYKTQDHKFVVLGALEDKFWSSFCLAVGHPEWSGRQQEPMPQTALIHELRALFATAPRDSWVTLLAATDCCFEPLLEPDEVAAQPQVIYRQLIQPARGEALPTDLRLPIISDQKIPRPRQPLCELPFEAVAAVWQL